MLNIVLAFVKKQIIDKYWHKLYLWNLFLKTFKALMINECFVTLNVSVCYFDIQISSKFNSQDQLNKYAVKI